MVSQKTKYLGIVLILFLLLLFYKCPFQFITGLPCPGCNMKTSLYYLLKGNIQLSLYYHALLVPTLICGVLCLLKPEKRKRILINILKAFPFPITYKWHIFSIFTNIIMVFFKHLITPVN